MATREVFDCDRCGSKAVKTHQVSVTVDRYNDAAGSMDNDERFFDLCHLCEHTELVLLLDRFSHELAQDWVQRVTGKPFRFMNGKLRLPK